MCTTAIIEERDREISQLKSTNLYLHKTMRQKDVQISALTETNRNLGCSIFDLRNSNLQLQEDGFNLRKRVQTIEKENASQRLQINEFISRIDVLENTVVTHQNQNQELWKIFNTLVDDVNALRNQGQSQIT